MTIHWPFTKLALMIVVAAWVITWNDPVIDMYRIDKSPEPLVLLPLPSVVSLLAAPPTAPPDCAGEYQ